MATTSSESVTEPSSSESPSFATFAIDTTVPTTHVLNRHLLTDCLDKEVLSVQSLNSRFKSGPGAKQIGQDSFLVAAECTSIMSELKNMSADLLGGLFNRPQSGTGPSTTVFGELVSYEGIEEDTKERLEPYFPTSGATRGRLEIWPHDPIPTRFLASVTGSLAHEDFNHVTAEHFPSGEVVGPQRLEDPQLLAPGSSIAIVSLGASRRMRLRKVKGKNQGKNKSIRLGAGSLLILGPKTLTDWAYSFPKSKSNAPGRRLQLTYRSTARELLTYWK